MTKQEETNFVKALIEAKGSCMTAEEICRMEVNCQYCPLKRTFGQDFYCSYITALVGANEWIKRQVADKLELI